MSYDFEVSPKILNDIRHLISMKSFLLCVFISFLALFVSGCGGGDASNTSSAQTSTSNSIDNSAAPKNSPAIWSGVKQLGAANSSTTATSTIADSSGNVFVAGFTNGGLDGNQRIGDQDGFVTKYNSSGIKQNTKQIGVLGATTTVHSITSDSSGNIYVTGDTSADLEGNTLTGHAEMFLTKYDGNGTKIFTRQLGVVGADTLGRSIAVDGAGNIYVSGITKGGLDGNSLVGLQDAFIVKYSVSGTKQWTKQVGVALKSTNSYGVTADPSGNVLIAGATNGGLDGNTLIGRQDFYIAKYDTKGVKVWVKQDGASAATATGRSIVTDTSGASYIVGSTDRAFGGNSFGGTQDMYVAKFDSAGVRQFVKQIGINSALTYGQGVTIDTVGNLYVVGYTQGDLDGIGLTGTQDIFMTKFDNTGLKQFTRLLGSRGSQSAARGVTIDLSGNLFLAGYTSGGLGDNILTGVQDFIVAKYSGSGERQ